jgi:membrane-bound lytic murein transglycosylase B
MLKDALDHRTLQKLEAARAEAAERLRREEELQRADKERRDQMLRSAAEKAAAARRVREQRLEQENREQRAEFARVASERRVWEKAQRALDDELNRVSVEAPTLLGSWWGLERS